jgi:hypothetical protein
LRLAFPNPTIGNIAELSGAGDKIPAPALDASFPGSPASNSPTRNPARANSKAIDAPISPAPAMATSKLFISAV